jgi:hypothetical protein
MKRRLIFLGVFPAGIGNKVDERVGPGRILIGYPVAEDIDVVFVL